MNATSTIFLVLILSIFLSCTKSSESNKITTCSNFALSEYPGDPKIPDLCNLDICNNYFTIWKELLQEKNNLDEDFFNNHIQPHYSEIHNWAKGASYVICYNLQIDWAVKKNCDKFIININPDNTHYPLLDLPRDTNLTKEEVKLAIENRAFSSLLANINTATSIVHDSLEDALNELIDFSEVNTLCFNRLIINKDNGNITLSAIAEYEDEDNLCIQGNIDLITGEKTVMDKPCRI